MNGEAKVYRGRAAIEAAEARGEKLVTITRRMALALMSIRGRAAKRTARSLSKAKTVAKNRVRDRMQKESRKRNRVR